MNKKIHFIFAFLFCFTTSVFSQYKFEKEYRIDTENVPAIALQFITNCSFTKKVKWYKEESQDGISFEAKTKYQKHKFSIEFDTTGHILDVEKKLKTKQLSSSNQNVIEKALSASFEKYKIVKLQEQWTGNEETLLELIQKNESSGLYQVRYEIVVKGKKDGSKNLYEVLLDTTAKVLNISKIIERPTDNLEF